MLNKGDGVERQEVNGVSIGHVTASETLVPRLYNTRAVANGKPVRIFDVPGFKDTDDKKTVIINILHKCLLNRVSHAKFVVILDINILFGEERMHSFVDDYHGKLKELFGPENYRSSFGNIYFVLTQNDKHGYTDAQIKEQGLKKMMEMTEINNEHLVSFFTHLLKNYMVVDYENNTQADFIEQLNEAMSVMNNKSLQNGSAGEANQLYKAKLNAYANDLNQRAAMTMDTKLEELGTPEKGIWKDMAVGAASLIASAEEARKALETLFKEVQDTKKTIAKMEEESHKAKALIVTNRSVMEDMWQRIETCKMHDAYLASNEQFFSKTLDDFDNISVRTDISVETGVFSSKFVFNSIIEITADEWAGNCEILIIRNEVGNETLKTYYQEKGHGYENGEPKRLQDVQDCQLPSMVLFNKAISDTPLPNRGASPQLTKAEFKYDRSKQSLLAKVEGIVPFKVLVYTAKPFSKTSAGAVLTEQNSQHRRKNEDDLYNHECTLKTATKESADAEITIEQNSIKLRQTNQELSILEDQLVLKTRGFVELGNELKENMEKEKKKHRAMGPDSKGGDEVMNSIDKISGIFASNSIGTTFAPKMTAFKKTLSQILSELSSHSTTLDHTVLLSKEMKDCLRSNEDEHA